MDENDGYVLNGTYEDNTIIEKTQYLCKDV